MPSAWPEPGVWAFTGRQGNLSLNVVTLEDGGCRNINLHDTSLESPDSSLMQNTHFSDFVIGAQYQYQPTHLRSIY